MIYTMTREIAVALNARGFPVEICYGKARQRLSSDVGIKGRRIVIDRDRTRSDSIEPFPGGQRNPRALSVRGVAVEALISAESPLAGARQNEHEHDCDQIVDAFLVELREWCVAARAGEPPIDEARYLGPNDYPPEEAPPAGVTYRVRFRVPRAILRRAYDGTGEPTGTIASPGVAFSVLRVTLDGESYEEVPLTE